jgi:SNF2 family DNA or RNA helicase
VKQFNEDESVPLFLVSLKAGGSGLNLVGADTVIHYDMWWNPAVENQATDRVWRMGQKQAVSSYKLITMGTIEEKILELQNRKKELLKEIVQTDEEVISKLTWEEVLELLKI